MLACLVVQFLFVCSIWHFRETKTWIDKYVSE